LALPGIRSRALDWKDCFLHSFCKDVLGFDPKYRLGFEAIEHSIQMIRKIAGLRFSSLLVIGRSANRKKALLVNWC